MNSGKLRNVFRRNRDEALIASAIFLSYIVLHLLLQRHELMAYDMYTYTSFAQHYAENWFYTVIPDQAHGLQIVSYPPLLFQLMALISFVPFLGQKWISIILVSGAATALSFSFYQLVKELLDLDGRKYRLIILLTAFSPGLLKFSLVHGQLPFLAGMTLSFLSAKYFYRIIHGADFRRHLMVSLALTAFIHHFSLLMSAILILVLALIDLRETVARIGYIAPPAAFAGLLAFIGLYPMIQETLFGISQGVIFHGSRNPLQAIKFFNQYVTTTYGASIIGLGIILKKYERVHSVNIVALVFMTLGLGMVTPTAEILFGGMADFIVYDRFSLISSLFLTSLLGFYLVKRRIKIGSKDVSRLAAAAFIVLGLVTVFWANAIHFGAVAGYGNGYDVEKTEAAADFLQSEASKDYLYLTVGHEPPVGELDMRTEVPTLDTGYYQGRKHGLLPDKGRFDRIDGDYSEILKNADNLSLKYVLVFEKDRDSWFDDDWRNEELDKGVEVWINPDAESYQPELGERRILFTTFPLFVLLFSILSLFSGKVGDLMDRLFERLRNSDESATDLGERSWLFILLFPLIAAAPSFLTSGYPAGIDTPAHIFKPELMSQMVAEYGRTFFWTDQWYNGYPFMAMYPPVTTNLIYHLNNVFQSITFSYNLVRLVAVTGVSAAVYLLTDRITSDSRVRLITAAFAVFSYPLYSNLYTIGRLASALALPVYFLLIYLLLRDDVFQREVSRGHIYIGLTAGILFLMHSMMAYLFIFTGLIFCIVYRNELTAIGLKPFLVTFSVPLVMSMPYIIRLLQHFTVTSPSWYVQPQPFSLSSHLEHSFDIIPPVYTGWLQTGFFSIGILKCFRLKDRFFSFLAANFGFFFLAFWARNFGVAYFLPLSGQFDLARFEILFAVFGILIAAYGLRYLFEEYLEDIRDTSKTIFAAVIVLFLVIETAPMLTQSMNWEPKFSDELDEIEFEGDYRAVGVDMRQWHTYILHEAGLMNTFGWFNQADPNPYFRKSLQRSGGRWHGWNFVQDVENKAYRNNLMELSNTRYVVSAEGEWMDERRSMQVKGLDSLNHDLNQGFIDDLRSDSNFSVMHESEYLTVMEFERDISYCEGVEPVWIEDDYRDRADQMLLEREMLPEMPVNVTGEEPEVQGKDSGKASGVECSRTDPYTRTVEVEEPGWVLLKESYYPFWERESGKEIYRGFGFMVVHVEEKAELDYEPRDVSTLSLDDFTSIAG